LIARLPTAVLLAHDPCTSAHGSRLYDCAERELHPSHASVIEDGQQNTRHECLQNAMGKEGGRAELGCRWAVGELAGGVIRRSLGVVSQDSIGVLDFNESGCWLPTILVRVVLEREFAVPCLDILGTGGRVACLEA